MAVKDPEGVSKRLEKNIEGWQDNSAALVSTAISLKRIAIALEGIEATLHKIWHDMPGAK